MLKLIAAARSPLPPGNTRPRVRFRRPRIEGTGMISLVFEDVVGKAVKMLRSTDRFPHRRKITSKTFADARSFNLISGTLFNLAPAGGGWTVGDHRLAHEAIRQELLFQNATIQMVC
ncbi:hypothetical protein [Bradyrhizobium canariense]|uniref:hypothetical protein n=1 Tax=Bradyrhizobium canariense TaxID=255045 RepID=UPI0011774060|nr:hypothetical protein [Bradyrhizobium canariense]